MGNVISAFNLKQAAGLSGLSENQLVSWDQDNFITPSMAADNRRSPYSRIYSFDDIVSLRTLQKLRSLVSLQHLKRAAQKLQMHSGRPWSELTLYVLNKEVYFKNPTDGKIEGAVTGQLGATIPLQSVVEEVESRIVEMRARPRDTIGHVITRRHVMGGEPIFAGTRILVESVISLIRSGYSDEEILRQYPDLEHGDVMAAKVFSRKLTDAA